MGYDHYLCLMMHTNASSTSCCSSIERISIVQSVVISMPRLRYKRCSNKIAEKKGTFPFSTYVSLLLGSIKQI